MTIDPPRRSVSRAWSVDAQAVTSGLDANADAGLTGTEAARRLAEHGPNELEAAPSPSWWSRIIAQFANPLVLLLVGAIVISLIAWQLEDEGGVPLDAIVIGIIIVLNAGLGAVQEERAERAIAALSAMAAGKATVVRDGRRVAVAAREVVPGDVLLVEEGDAIAADARVIASAGLKVAEASLTGESEAVEKGSAAVAADAALGDRTSMLHAGTSAVWGHGRAVVTATAMDTEVGHIATLLSETEQQPTPLEREITAIGRLLGIAVIVISLIVIGVTLLVSEIEEASDVVEVLLIGVSLAVAAVPEGLPAVLSVVLALGVQRMARRNAIMKRLSSAETLGSATVICTDKTGTLTRSEMSVRAVITADDRVELAGVGYDPTPPPDADALPSSVRRALTAAAAASNAAVQHIDDQWEPVGDPTEAALVVAASRAAREVDADSARRAELPFSSERKRMSVLLEDDSFGVGRHLVKGAPDVILERCGAERVGDEDHPLDDARRDWWADRIDDLADGAMRTLAVAARRHETDTLVEDDEHGLTLLGVFGIIDPPRPEAPAAVAAAHAAGIRVIMITGDHPRTAGQIAADIGIAPLGARVVSGPEIEETPDDQLAEIAASTLVFARVAPAHKLRLVEALQARHEVVAMTGDGVNDAPALKAADLGAAMGTTGTDVAREAADMVLTDDNFATITAAVEQGRSIFHNIRSFLRYLLSSNIGEVFTMFFGVVLASVLGLDGEAAIVAPLTATQILWINLLTDTAPALALGVDPPEDDLMRRQPRPLGARVIDAPMQHGIALVGFVMAVVTLFMLDLKLPGGLIEGTADLDEARTAAFTVLVLTQLFNCFNARSDLVSAFRHWAANRLLLAAILLSLALQFAVVYLPALNEAFETAPLGFNDWILATVLASAVLWVSEIRKWIRRRSAGPAPAAS